MITQLSQVKLMRSNFPNGETQSYWDMKEDFTIVIHEKDLWRWKELVIKHLNIVMIRQDIPLQERKHIIKREWRKLCKYGWQKEEAVPIEQAA